ncbi:hypothetical protein VNO78_37273 [Psophocarpus tetragonolobus]|uniref:NADH-ubiquinone oxidoreductase chain 4L n=1 Tax=Psophocarpus tetragonolobus TaxID=3891 RepID=A0AAN9NCW8_PSOTE
MWTFYIQNEELVLNKRKKKIFRAIHDMFLMVTEFINYSEQIIRAARYIGQGLMITLSHANRLPVTIQYPYEKIISSERFRGRIHFEFDKCIACEVCVRVCPIDLPIVDWKLETDIRKKRLLNYSIDFGICIFCGNCIEYCPTNCLSMTEEYELSTYDRHELNYNLIALGRLPHALVLSAFLFSIGIYGLITSRNMVRALMCLELILNAVNINLVTFSDFFDRRQLKGNIFSIFVIAVAAAEAAIGPAIVSSIYRNRKSTRINQSNLLNK